MDQTSRDPWRTIWHIATSDYLMTVVVLGIAAGLAITLWLPQMPGAAPVAYARWLSEVQARFKSATPTIQMLGLFTVTRSLGFRALLALLAGCLLLRLTESSHQLRQYRQLAEPAGAWRALADAHLPAVMDTLHRRHYRVLSAPPLFQADRWPWADLFPILTQGGALLFLAGLLVTHLWGWQVAGLIAQSGEQVTLPGTDEWVALNGEACRATHSSSIVTHVEQCGPGVRASATNSTGQALPLQQTASSAPVAQLTVPLTEDQFFAIPEAQLIIRLASQPGHAIHAHSPVLVQVYRSPPGRLTAETVVEREAELTVGDVTLKLTSTPYARLTATFNPGLWPTGAGLVLLGMGMLGSVVWPVRRLWLRQETEQLEGTGDLLPTSAWGREA